MNIYFHTMQEKRYKGTKNTKARYSNKGPLFHAKTQYLGTHIWRRDHTDHRYVFKVYYKYVELEIYFLSFRFIGIVSNKK